MAEPQKSATTKAIDEKSPSFLWIVNNRDGVIILAHRPIPQPESKTFALPKTHALPPGASIVPREYWEKWKLDDAKEAHRLLHAKIPGDSSRERRPERVGQTHLMEGPQVSDPKNPLSEIDQETAIALVDEIYDQPLLEHLLKIERRDTVAAALNVVLEKFRRGMRSQGQAG